MSATARLPSPRMSQLMTVVKEATTSCIVWSPSRKQVRNHLIGSTRSMTHQPKECHTDDCNDYSCAGSARRDRGLRECGHTPADALRDRAGAGRSGTQPAARTARCGAEPGPHLVPLPAAAGLFLGLADLLAGVPGESAPDLTACDWPGAGNHRGGGHRSPLPARLSLVYRLCPGSGALADRCRSRQRHCPAY